jgi:hypothetical protein
MALKPIPTGYILSLYYFQSKESRAGDRAGQTACNTKDYSEAQTSKAYTNFLALCF